MKYKQTNHKIESSASTNSAIRAGEDEGKSLLGNHRHKSKTPRPFLAAASVLLVGCRSSLGYGDHKKDEQDRNHPGQGQGPVGPAGAGQGTAASGGPQTGLGGKLPVHGVNGLIQSHVQQRGAGWAGELRIGHGTQIFVRNYDVETRQR